MFRDYKRFLSRYVLDAHSELAVTQVKGYDIVDNRESADTIQKLERSEKARQPKKSGKGHVLVTFGDSANPNAPGTDPVKVN